MAFITGSCARRWTSASGASAGSKSAAGRSARATSSACPARRSTGRWTTCRRGSRWSRTSEFSAVHPERGHAAGGDRRRRRGRDAEHDGGPSPLVPARAGAHRQCVGEAARRRPTRRVAGGADVITGDFTPPDLRERRAIRPAKGRFTSHRRRRPRPVPHRAGRPGDPAASGVSIPPPRLGPRPAPRDGRRVERARRPVPGRGVPDARLGRSDAGIGRAASGAGRGAHRAGRTGGRTRAGAA